MVFFTKVLGPHLGRGPLVSDSGVYRPQYLSAMTKDLTPFELSLCWKERKQKGKPIVRLVNDVIPANAKMTRTASLAQSLPLIDALQKVTKSKPSDLTLHVLPDIWRAVSKTLQASEPNIILKVTVPDVVHHPRSLASI